jgi:hypothetical protein
VKRAIDKYSPLSITCKALVIKHAYSDGYIKYQEKDIIEQITDNIPPGDTDRFYPSQEEQATVMAKSNAVDKKYHMLSELFKNDYYPAWGEMDTVLDMKYAVSKFLATIMFKDKVYHVIQDKRLRTQLQQSLVCYIWGLTDIQMFMTSEEYETWLNSKMDSA